MHIVPIRQGKPRSGKRQPREGLAGAANGAGIARSVAAAESRHCKRPRRGEVMKSPSARARSAGRGCERSRNAQRSKMHREERSEGSFLMPPTSAFKRRGQWVLNQPVNLMRNDEICETWWLWGEPRSGERQHMDVLAGATSRARTAQRSSDSTGFPRAKTDPPTCAPPAN